MLDKLYLVTCNVGHQQPNAWVYSVHGYIVIDWKRIALLITSGWEMGEAIEHVVLNKTKEIMQGAFSFFFQFVL